MNKYEAMFIVNPELSEEEKKSLFKQIHEVITKNEGEVTSADIWSEKRKLSFPIKKHKEGIYYLVNFNIAAGKVTDIRHAYKLNENILRVLITRHE
ncbi:MAG: 30S ribosomal protein S6 [Candidatus Omnitrophota bacterium]|nr:MAG: 30S ribosomal protein S6 [Candidatus Omnitrophota bacterium]